MVKKGKATLQQISDVAWLVRQGKNKLGILNKDVQEHFYYINGKEFICEDDGEVKLFDSIDSAKAWLKEQDPTIDVDAEDLMDANGLDIEEDE